MDDKTKELISQTLSQHAVFVQQAIAEHTAFTAATINKLLGEDDKAPKKKGT